LKSTATIVLVWVLVGALIYWAFNFFILRQHNPNTQQLTVNSSAELRLKRSRDGHFRLSAQMNGEPIVFLVDTGASMVTMDQALAQRLQLTAGEAFITQTANGQVAGYWSQVARLTFGPYELSNLRVGVVPNMSEEVLLGMNVLKNFSVQISGDQMLIKPLVSQ
jgi:aspartyl protease family protein